MLSPSARQLFQTVTSSLKCMTPISSLVSLWPCLPQKNRRHRSKFLQLPAVKLTHLHLHSLPPISPLDGLEEISFVLLKTGSHPFLTSQECYSIHLSLPTGCIPWACGQDTASNPQVLLQIPHSLSSLSWRSFPKVYWISPFHHLPLTPQASVSGFPTFIPLKLYLKNWPIISLF